MSRKIRCMSIRRVLEMRGKHASDGTFRGQRAVLQIMAHFKFRPFQEARHFSRCHMFSVHIVKKKVCNKLL